MDTVERLNIKLLGHAVIQVGEALAQATSSGCDRQHVLALMRAAMESLKECDESYSEDAQAKPALTTTDWTEVKLLAHAATQVGEALVNTTCVEADKRLVLAMSRDAMESLREFATTYSATLERPTKSLQDVGQAEASPLAA